MINLTKYQILCSKYQKFKKKTAKQLNKTDLQLKITQIQLDGLLCYNKNRDHELEMVFLKTFVDYLKKNNWSACTVDIDEVYDQQGKVITEWDGIVYATHENISYPCLFFIETKQIFTTQKLQNFYERLDKMKNDILPNLNFKDPDAKQIYKGMAKIFSLHFDNTTRVYGVIGSPNIEQGAKDKISASTSFITLTKDVYKVVLQL
jgi:hypothetical protein